MYGTLVWCCGADELTVGAGGGPVELCAFCAKRREKSQLFFEASGPEREVDRQWTDGPHQYAAAARDKSLCRGLRLIGASETCHQALVSISSMITFSNNLWHLGEFVFCRWL